MQIYNLENQKVTAELKRGLLYVTVKSQVDVTNKKGCKESTEREEKFDTMSLTCDKWLKLMEKDISDYPQLEPAKQHIETIKKYAEEGMRFLKSVTVSDINKNSDGSWYIQFMISINNRSSKIQINVTSDEYCCASEKIGDLGLISLDNIIEQAYIKAEEQIADEFNYLDSMLTLSMEEDGLRVVCGKHNVMLSYNEWISIDGWKFTKKYGYKFGRYIDMIKESALRLIDCITTPLEPPKKRQIRMMDDGNVRIDEIPISYDEPIYSPKTPPSSNLTDYKEFLKGAQPLIHDGIEKCEEEHKIIIEKVDDIVKVKKNNIESVEEEEEKIEKMRLKALGVGECLSGKQYTQIKTDVEKIKEKFSHFDPKQEFENFKTIEKNKKMETIIPDKIKARQERIKEIFQNRDEIKTVLNKTYDDEKLVDELIDNNPVLAEGMYNKIKEDFDGDETNATKCN